MAIQTLRRLDDLEKQCRDLGLVPVPTKRKKLAEGEYTLINSKDDCIKVLREFFIAERKRKGEWRNALDFILQIDSPMLCLQLKELKEAEQQDVWRDGSDFIFEEKLDGCRMVVCFDKQQGFDFYSRNNSVEDFLPISYKENVLLPNLDYSKITDSFIIDSEVINLNPNVEDNVRELGIIAETQLQLVSSILALNPEQSRKIQELNPLKFWTFDILWFNGESVMDKPYFERRKILNTVVTQLKEAGFECDFPINHLQSKLNKKDFYNSIVSRGGEGCIAKNIHAAYDITGRRHGDWLKIKRTVSESVLSEGLGDTLDAFVIGYDLADPDKAWANLVGSLTFGVFLSDDEGNLLLDESGNPRVHALARISNITQALREQITEYDENNNPVLKKSVYGKVASIDGQDVSSKALRFTHAILVDWRPDRSADTCVVKESFLRRLVL